MELSFVRLCFVVTNEASIVDFHGIHYFIVVPSVGSLQMGVGDTRLQTGGGCAKGTIQVIRTLQT